MFTEALVDVRALFGERSKGRDRDNKLMYS
jgi:hypothetical protein